jgi:hypothetical protein
MSLSMPSKIVFCDNTTAYWESDKIYTCKYNYNNINEKYGINHIYIEILNINIYVTYQKKDEINEFVRGFLYKDDKEYEILYFCRYHSLQIGEHGYDNIATCKLDSIIF